MQTGYEAPQRYGAQQHGQDHPLSNHGPLGYRRPKGCGNCQEVGDNTNSPGGGCLMTRDAGQMVTL